MGYNYEWSDKGIGTGRSYKCGYCGTKVAPQIIYSYGYNNGYQGFSNIEKEIYICPNCNSASFMDYKKNKIVPGSTYGQNIEGLSENVKKLYDEARNCYGINANSGVVMICRKIIMHIAVDHGEDEGLTFAGYIDLIEKENYLGKKAKNWIDKIRKYGNDANHKIREISNKEAEDTLYFTELLLKNLYEAVEKEKSK